MSSIVLEAHKKAKWKISIKSKMPLETKADLSVAYTPWVAEPCLEIAKDVNKVYDYTSKGNLVAVVSDWTAVLWLWDIWPEAAMPVMEGKSVLFKEFGGVDAFPICLRTKDVEEIIRTIKYLEPTFWWINLEDISAPRCFEIEERLKKELNIPVFHDDQHWTAIVVLAGLINACKITWKNMNELVIVLVWAWAAWIATSKLLILYWVWDIILVDSIGAIYEWRGGLNKIKQEMAKITNKRKIQWDIAECLKGADVFIGVSKAGLLNKAMLASMAKDSIIFAMANPIPEIMPDEARAAWAKIVATWRSDFPNQVNNVLAFPGIFRWVLDVRASQITDEMKIMAATAISNYIKNPDCDNILPSPLDKWVALAVAEAVRKCHEK